MGGGGGAIIEARGVLRDGVGSLWNLQSLLRSPKVAGRSLDAVLPDVRVAQAELPEACLVLTERLSPEYDGDAALAELCEFVAERAREVHDAIARAELTKVDARSRLALERVIEARTPDLDAARGLYDLLLGSVGETELEIELPGVIEEAFSPMSPRATTQGLAAVTVDVARRPAASCLARPTVGIGLVLIAIASVRTAGSPRPHVRVGGGQRAVMIDSSAGEGDHVLVASPRLIAPTERVARLAARRAGFDLDFGSPSRVVFPAA